MDMTLITEAALVADEEFTGLFADLVADIPTWDGVPKTPRALVAYTRSITRPQIRREVERVFVTWLRRELGIEQRILAKVAIESFPCALPDVIGDYFPEWPIPEDFTDGTDDPEFRSQERSAEIVQARAKQICWEVCPVRELCLNRSMHADAEYDEVRGESQFDFWSVLGGWGPGARIAIYNGVVNRQRAYRKGTMPKYEREYFESLAGTNDQKESC